MNICIVLRCVYISGIVYHVSHRRHTDRQNERDRVVSDAWLDGRMKSISHQEVKALPTLFSVCVSFIHRSKFTCRAREHAWCDSQCHVSSVYSYRTYTGAFVFCDAQLKKMKKSISNCVQCLNDNFQSKIILCVCVFFSPFLFRFRSMRRQR